MATFSVEEDDTAALYGDDTFDLSGLGSGSGGSSTASSFSAAAKLEFALSRSEAGAPPLQLVQFRFPLGALRSSRSYLSTFLFLRECFKKRRKKKNPFL